MFELVVRPLLTCTLWLCLALSASAGEMARGQVISVAGGDVITLLDGVVVLFVQIGALSPETQYPCGFPAGATLAR
ncbi:MAG: hypothetical protein J0M00_18885 [Burkholderiales bacterium]|nr:hypothetical protein [Burkholderiales bacterium]QIQ10758.1 hypothetical protein FIAIKCIJ_00013 [uncultured bacterium]